MATLHLENVKVKYAPGPSNINKTAIKINKNKLFEETTIKKNGSINRSSIIPVEVEVRKNVNKSKPNALFTFVCNRNWVVLSIKS